MGVTFEVALRATEVVLALAFIQQSLEHVFGARDVMGLMTVRVVLAVALLFGGVMPDITPWVLLALCVHSVVMLHRFGGPYNGGSDRMGFLVLYCLTGAHWAERWEMGGIWAEAAFGYLSVQVILSYFVSGYVKIVNPDWRSGQALRDVFGFSAYPVAENLRGLADRPRLMWGASWAVMVFELAFPLSLLAGPVLIGALGLALLFHVANACLFGLNRFVWVWVAAYPSLLWFQGRILG